MSTTPEEPRYYGAVGDGVVEMLGHKRKLGDTTVGTDPRPRPDFSVNKYVAVDVEGDIVMAALTTHHSGAAVLTIPAGEVAENLHALNVHDLVARIPISMKDEVPEKHEHRYKLYRLSWMERMMGSDLIGVRCACGYHEVVSTYELLRLAREGMLDE